MEGSIQADAISQTANNEAAKYVANAYDRASTAILALGVFTPFVSVTFGFGDFTQRYGAGGVVIAGGWFATAIVLHYCGKSFLRRVR